MTALLFEGNRTFYLVLGIILILLVVIYWQNRSRGVLVAAGVVLGLLALYLLLDVVVETELEKDRQQMRERIELMARAVGQRDPDALFRHIGENFVSPQGRSKKATYDFARGLITSGQVTEIRVWDFEFEQPPSRAKGEGTIRFQFKVLGPIAQGGIAFGCEATFEWAGSRGWLLKKTVIFNPVMGRQALEPVF